jgi:hypothetical protein
MFYASEKQKIPQEKKQKKTISDEELHADIY